MDLLKKCSKCQELKTLENFHKHRKLSYGVAGTCKSCKAAICHNYYIKNSETCKEKSLQYFYANKDKRNSWEKNKLQNDLLFKLKKTLSHRVRRALHRLNEEKIDAKITHDVGCSIEELKIYLESKFTPGMTWDNWGIRGWHIDHVKPLSLARNEQELITLCHYTNLQPLWAKDNLSKSDKVD